MADRRRLSRCWKLRRPARTPEPLRGDVGALFFNFKQPAGDRFPVLLLFFQVQQDQSVLAEPVVREAQRPVMVVGFKLQRGRRGGGLALVIEQYAQTQQLYKRQELFFS